MQLLSFIAGHFFGEVVVFKSLGIVLLWSFFIFGAMYHRSGEYEELRRAMPVPLLIFTTFFLSYLTLKRGAGLKTLIWILGIGVTGFYLEVIGVRTQALFGPYLYGEALGVKVLEVPLVMAAAWIKVIILGCSFFAVRIRNPFLGAFMAAIVITIYDIALEPAAIELDYWVWLSGTPPLQNYLVWFIASYVLAVIGLYGRVFTSPMPLWLVHLLLAEELYFYLVAL